MICIGLMGLGGVLFFTRANRAQEEAAIAATLIPPTPIPPTFTPTSTNTPAPTNTPLPTPTSTPVVGPGAVAAQPEPGETEEETEAQAEVTPTSTPVVQGPTTTAAPAVTATPAVVPDSGGVLSAADSAFLLWIAGGLIMILLLYGLFNRIEVSSRYSKK